MAIEPNSEALGFDENNPAPTPPENQRDLGGEEPAPAPEEPQRSPFDFMGQAMDATKQAQAMGEGLQAAANASGLQTVENVKAMFKAAEPPKYQSKFDFINKKTHEEPLVVPPEYPEQLGQQAPEEPQDPTRESHPELFKNSDGLSFGNNDEYKQLERERREERISLSGYLIDNNPDVFKDDPNITQESWDPDYVFEKLGRTPEEEDFIEKNWYARRGYAMPDERYQQRAVMDYTEWDEMSPEQREEHNAWRASKGLAPATREDFGKFVRNEFVNPIALMDDVGPANPRRAEEQEAFRAKENEEALELFNQRLEYARVEGEFEKGDPRARELAERASSIEHLEILIQKEDERFQRIYGDQKYVAPQGDVADDMGDYHLGFMYRIQRGMEHAAESVAPTLASAGASVYATGARLLGMDPEMFDNYTASVADHAVANQLRNQVIDEASLRVNRVVNTGIDGFDRFMTETAYKGGEIYGMLLFDMGTSFVTGKLPGATTLMSAVGRQPARAITALNRSFTTGVLARRGTSAMANAGRASAKSVERVAKLPPSSPTTYRAMQRGPGSLTEAIKTSTTAGLAHDAAGAMRRIGARQITHGPNTFLARVYGESYAASMARQQDRAASEGREVTLLDSFNALSDATASATIAHLIGKHIPQFKNRLPSNGPGSGGMFSILGNRGFTPKTIEAATTRAKTRALLAPVRSGADFALFDLLMDAYALTDQDDRMDVLFRYAVTPDKQFTSMFGSFLIGMPMGVTKMPTQYRAEFRKFREYKDGAAAITFLQGLKPEAKREILDAFSNAHFEGARDRLKAEKEYVYGKADYLGEKRTPLKDYDRETLAEILFYGDRELPSHMLSTMEGVPGEIGARFTESGSTANKSHQHRELLIGPDGKIEVTRNMARLELQRRGEAIDAVETMGGKIDTLFMGKTEATSRRQAVAAEMGRRFAPSSPKPGQVTGVRGFVENLKAISKHPLIMRSTDIMRELDPQQRRRVVQSAAEMAYADALVSGNSVTAAKIRRMGVLARGGTKPGRGIKSGDMRIGPTRFNDPVLRPYLRKAIHQTGMHRVVRQKRNLDPAMQKASTVVDNLIRSNERLAKWVVSEASGGRNTPESPAISRRQMERLAGGRISKQENTKQARYELGRMIHAVAREKLAPINENVRGVRMKPSRGELAPPRQAPIPLEQATTPTAMGKAVSKPQVMTAAAYQQKVEEAKKRGAKPLALEPLVVEKPASMERDQPIDKVIDRLDAKDQIEAPLREPVPVRAADGNPVFGIPIKDRMRMTLKRLRDEFGIENVELDFSEGFYSLLGNSVHAVGRANGYSVVIAHGSRNKAMPEVMDMGYGIIVFHNSVQPQVARGQLASRGATLRWFAEREGTNPLNWIEHHIAGGVGLKRMIEVYKARTGRETTTQEFKDGLLLASESPAQAAVAWEMLFPILSSGERQQIISRYPREMAEWYQHQMTQIQGAGFAPPRKNATVLGGAKESNMILGVADGSVEYAGAKGNTKSSIVTGIDKVFDRRKDMFSTPSDIVAEYRANREALAAELAETTKSPEGLPVEAAKLPEGKEKPFDRAEAEARVAEQAYKPEVVDLFPEGKFDVPAAREIERKFPGFFKRAQSELKRNSRGGSPVQFEYHGYMFSVSPKNMGNGKVQVGKLTSELVQWEGRAEALMSPEGREVAEKNMELNASAPTRERATERELTSEREAGGAEPPSPPKPEAPGETPEPGKPGEVNAGFIEGPQQPLGIKAKIQRGLQYVMDPANYANIVGLEPFKKLIFDAYEAVEATEALKGAKIERVGRIFADLRKDKSSELVNGKDSSALIRILEGAEIAPNMAALDAHPLTAKLSAKEKGYIIEIKEIFEAQRQDQMSMMRETVRVGYNSAGKASELAKRANEYDKDLNVKVVKSGRRKMFEVNDGKSRVQFDREGFIDFMVQKQVPENYGYKHSYFPHMFFGKYRATVVAKDKNGNEISTNKLGLGEKGTIEGERQQIMESVQAKMKEIRERFGEEVSFDVQIRDGSTNIPKEAMYMPLDMRRRLVRTLRSETGASASEINSALRGKLSSKPVKTAFLSSMLEREGAEGYSMNAQRVIELAINSHYRNLLSRRLQKESQPQLEALAEMGAPQYIQQYARNNLQHIMYGTRREQAAAENRLDAHIAKGSQLMRSVQFYRQLMRPAQHIINSTQVTQVAALIGFKEFIGAVKDYNSAEGRKYIEEYGFFDLNGRFDAGKFGDSLNPTGAGFLHKVHGTVNKATGKFWNANSEARNQNFAFYAMARHAMKNLGMSPQEAAVYGRLYGSLMTQYRYSRANDPVFLRGDVMRTLGQFKRFQIQTFGLLASLTKHAATGDVMPGLGQYGPLLRFTLINTVLGGGRASLLGAGALLTGSMGLGAYRSVKQMIDGDEYIGGLPTNPFKSEAAAYQWLRDNMGEGAAEMIMFGVMAGVGVDASGSFNLTNFGPGGFVDYVAGPTLGMVKRTYQDLQLRDAQARGVPVRMLESLINSGQATRSLKSLLELATFWEAFSEKDGGAYKNTPVGILSANEYRAGTSEMVRYRSLLDQFAAVAGFRSADGTSEYLMQANLDAFRQHWNDARNRIAAIYNRDPNAGREAMRKWNEAYGNMMYLGYGDIRAMRGTTEDRLTKSRTERNEQRRADEVDRAVKRLTEQRRGSK